MEVCNNQFHSTVDFLQNSLRGEMLSDPHSVNTAAQLLVQHTLTKFFCQVSITNSHSNT